MTQGLLLLITSLMVGASAQDNVSTSEQTQIIGKARETALQYTANLPNFISTETIRRSRLAKRSQTWKPEDTLTVDVAFSGKGERYNMLTINGKPTKKKFSKVDGAMSGGEFGSILHGIFLPESAATFHWERSEGLGGRTMHVFSYSIDQKHSGYGLNTGRRHILAAVGGLIYVDDETRNVMRITLAPSGIPASFPFTVASVLDYGFADIGGQHFLLPLHAELNVTYRDGSQARNVMDFDNYRKFTSEATLKFEP